MEDPLHQSQYPRNNREHIPIFAGLQINNNEPFCCLKESFWGSVTAIFEIGGSFKIKYDAIRCFGY